MLNVNLIGSDNEVGGEHFEAVALLHMQELYRTAAAMLRDRIQAQDIVQETYLRAWKAFSRFTPGTNCRAWLFKILFREISQHRRRWFNRSQFCGPEPLEWLVYKKPQSEDLTDEEILSALQKLPPRLAEVVLLADVHDFTYKEIQETLNIPIGTVMSRLSRGRSLMRSYLVRAQSERARPIAADVRTGMNLEDRTSRDGRLLVQGDCRYLRCSHRNGHVSPGSRANGCRSL